MIEYVIVGVGAVVVFTWPWWTRAIHRAIRPPAVVVPDAVPDPVTDWCETCNKPLHKGEAWEIRSDSNDDAAISDVPLMGGGTFMSATYCAEHAPPEAKHVP